MNQGLTDEEARSRIYLLDQSGLLGHTRSGTDVNQRPWVKHDQPDGTTLETLMETVKPGVLLGLTGFPGVFTEKSIRTMAAFTKRPIVFPLSNPTSRAEATAADIYNWTEGRAIFASGSPFDPVVMANGVTRYPSQANNFYCFPGIGLGALVAKAKWISDSMLYAAARALAAAVKDEDIAMGKVFPPVREIRRVTEEVAMASQFFSHTHARALSVRGPGGAIWRSCTQLHRLICPSLGLSLSLSVCLSVLFQ